MSGGTTSKECLGCGMSVMLFTDHRPTDQQECRCEHCGFYEQSIRGYMTIEQLDVYRKEEYESWSWGDPDFVEEYGEFKPLTEDEIYEILKQRKERKLEFKKFPQLLEC